jgi:hypothetical protein
MKTVAAHACVHEPIRNGEAASHLRHRGVERGVEAHHLGKQRMARAHGLDPGDRRRQMERRERHHRAQARQRRVVDEHRLGVLGSAVNQPMPDHRHQVDLRGAGAGELAERVVERSRGRAAGEALDGRARDGALLAVAHHDQRRLQRRGAAVEAEHDVATGGSGSAHGLVHFHFTISGMSSKCSRT